LSGYRRIEPQFCRGCGEPWTPGTDACPSCGEVIFRAPLPSDDPRALPKLRAVLLVTGAVIVARWVALVNLLGSPQPALWIAFTTGVLAVVVLSSPWWYPGGLPKSMTARPRAAALAIAAFAGVALPAIVALLGDGVLGGSVVEAVLAMGGLQVGLIALAIGAIAIEEALFRGLLFDGVAAIAGSRNAAIASALLFAVAMLDPLSIALGAAAAVLRAWSGTLAPALVLRLVALGAWIAWSGA